MSQKISRRALLGAAGCAAAASLSGMSARAAAAGLLPGESAGPVAAEDPTARAAASQPLYWSWWGWEPLDHYRRVGGNVAAVDTAAPWVQKWYDRLHSEELVAKMAGLGVNLAITHYFKGFGLKHEQAA
jgi:hypothetical protein